MVCLSILAVALRGVLLPIPAHVLVAEDQPKKGADFLVLLMGDSSSGRAEKTVDLFEAGYAGAVLIPAVKQTEFVRLGIVKGESDLNRDFLLAHEVPEEKVRILAECATTSTYDEAVCVRNFLSERSGESQRIVVVTSWYHTGRARWLFHEVFAGSGVTVQVVPAPLWDHGPKTWWKHEDSFLAVFNEYLKWAYWRLRL